MRSSLWLAVVACCCELHASQAKIDKFVIGFQYPGKHKKREKKKKKKNNNNKLRDCAAFASSLTPFHTVTG